jgi:hypothetical protein
MLAVKLICFNNEQPFENILCIENLDEN